MVEPAPLAVAQSSGPAKVPLAVHPSGRFLLTTDDQHAGLFLTDLMAGETRVINRSHNAGYYARFSPDGSRICFKLFRPEVDGEFTQAPAYYDIREDQTYLVGPYCKQVSMPAFCPDGKLAVVLNGQLLLVDPKGRIDSRRELGHTPNLLAFSPDSVQLAWTDQAEQIVQWQIGEADSKTITDGANSYWGPEFSPDGSRVLARTLNGRLVLIDPALGSQLEVPDGQQPQWLANDQVLAIAEEGKVRVVDFSEGTPNSREKGIVGPRWWATQGDLVVSQQKEYLVFERVQGSRMQEERRLEWTKPSDDAAPEPTAWPVDMREDGYNLDRGLVDRGSTIELVGVPYIHQVYDSPDWFDGHWACNAASALMCLGYWRAVAPDPIVVNRPETRRSNFARFVSEKYSIPGRTFDVSSPDPKGTHAYGGYGYIVRENWKDTKNFMADFIRLHGVESTVDWTPTLAKFRGEIDRARPLVVLHSITLAGHYVAGIGYQKGSGTIVTHDPYGDKNSRQYPHIDGRRARYDLPGYNNGYQNLRVVHCLIYTQGPMPVVRGAGSQ